MDQPGQTPPDSPTPPPTPGMGECVGPGPSPAPSSPSGGQAGGASPPRSSVPQPPHRPPPPAIQVVNRSGGFWRSVMVFITGMLALSVVFLLGMLIGALIGFAGAWGAGLDEGLIAEVIRDGSRDTVAVITVEGTIDARQADYVHRAVHHVLENSYDAVVLRIDSGGGGVTASDQIWHEFSKFDATGIPQIPVVASYGSVAASGGYYISCASDYIMAEETCITGSIGVQAQILTMGGLMDKVGIEPVTLAATGSPRKNVANDRYRTWTEEDRAEITKMLDSAYRTFNQRVRAGRGHVITDPAHIDALADGSIYTAQEATENGLIDGVGYLEDAIAQAETLAGLPVGGSTVVMISEPPSLTPMDLLFMKGGSGGAEGALDAEAIRALVNDLNTPRITYLMH